MHTDYSMLLITQLYITIKDHEQTLLQTITRPQLYSECGTVCAIQNTSIECFMKYKRRERSSSVLYLIKHGLLMF
jgi:hypothetical protein